MKHELKTLPKYFQAVWENRKTFEVRKDDRNFQVGDTLYIQEWNNIEGYTGDIIVRKIAYILGRHEDEKQFVPNGYVILGIK